MNELALFAGAGGGLLGGTLLGWRTVAAVEIEEYPRAVLLQRQADGILPRFPVWDDVRTFDGKPWRGKVDIITGGFPCQDISAAGKGAGITGERSGLWSEFARIIGEVRPAYVLVENSPMLVSRGLGVVLGDLASMGYDAEWGIIGAHHAGAPHRRDRIWILAHANDEGQSEREKRPGRSELNGQCHWWDKDPADIPDSWGNATGGTQGDDSRGDRPGETTENIGGWCVLRCDSSDCCWVWTTESRLGGMVDELADSLDITQAAFGGPVHRVEKNIQNRVDRLKAIGNGQVPIVAAVAFLTLYQRH